MFGGSTIDVRWVFVGSSLGMGLNNIIVALAWFGVNLLQVGLVTPDFLRRNRKFALVIVLSLSAIITPPDIASQIIVSIPILVLYEISIIISKIGYKKLNT